MSLAHSLKTTAAPEIVPNVVDRVLYSALLSRTGASQVVEVMFLVAMTRQLELCLYSMMMMMMMIDSY